MFFWVLLSCNRKVLVPINHCDLSNVNIWKFYNGGGVGKKIPKIFVSTNKNADANFDLDVSETFVEGVDACYSGKILACFGTEREAVSAGLLDENDIGTSSQVPLCEDDDENEVKEENEEEQREKRKQQIELLKKAATYLRNRLGTNDILDGELADFQDVLNDGEESTDDTINLLDNIDYTVPVDSQSQANLMVDGRQYDPLSGYMDFVVSSNGDRIYADVNLTIRQQCVKMWLYLNSDKPFSGPAYDEKFVRGLLLEVIGFQKLAKFEMDRSKLDFIRDIFAVRVLDDDSRLSHFEGYVQKKCNECKATFESNQQFYFRVKK